MQLVFVEGVVTTRYASKKRGKSRKIEIAFSGFITVPSDWDENDIIRNIDRFIWPAMYEQLPSNVLEAMEAIGGKTLIGIEDIKMLDEVEEEHEDIYVTVVENVWW